MHQLRKGAQHRKQRPQKAGLAPAPELSRAQNRHVVRKAWKEWKERWPGEAPAAVACLAEDLEVLGTFLAGPSEHHRLIRTTHSLERLLRELRRRTRPMGAFADKRSGDRLFHGVGRRVNRNWSRKTLPAFTQKP